MQSIAISLICLATISGPADAPSPEDSTRTTIHEVARQLGRGINLGNWLEAPREGAWGVRIEADHFPAIREAGFATIRLPVRWSAHAMKQAPYTIDETFAKRVDWALDRAAESGLNVVLNVHHYREMDEEPDAHLPRLVAIWRQVAKRYRERPRSVCFELFNEPNRKLTPEKWNSYVPALLAAVRETNPDRAVIVGPGHWNAIRGIDSLELPRKDRNLIVTVHHYQPFHFTHQGASWAKGSEKWMGTKWTGAEKERAEITQAFEKVAAWAKRHDRPIFLGEFGAYEKADLPSRLRWTRHIVTEAERLGFSWAYWEFCAGFGAYDAGAKKWREELKDALVGRARS